MYAAGWIIDQQQPHRHRPSSCASSDRLSRAGKARNLHPRLSGLVSRDHHGSGTGWQFLHSAVFLAYWLSYQVSCREDCLWPASIYLKNKHISLKSHHVSAICVRHYHCPHIVLATAGFYRFPHLASTCVKWQYTYDGNQHSSSKSNFRQPGSIILM